MDSPCDFRPGPGVEPPPGGRVTARQRTGRAAEQRALDYLTSRGLRPLARNYRVKVGDTMTLRSFGASAPAEQLFPHFGFSVEAIVPQIKAKLGL